MGHGGRADGGGHFRFAGCRRAVSVGRRLLVLVFAGWRQGALGPAVHVD